MKSFLKKKKLISGVCWIEQGQEHWERNNLNLPSNKPFSQRCSCPKNTGNLEPENWFFFFHFFIF